MRPSALDSPIWHALAGPQAAFADVAGPGPLAVRFQPDVGPFGAVADVDDPASWSALAELAGRGGIAVAMIVDDVTGEPRPWPPKGWELLRDLPGYQMVGDGMPTAPAPDAVPLGPADAGEMLALVEQTRPGPFARRTVELGGYLGIRRRGRLVAMAGRRLQPPGLAEISAVCTAPDQRGQGLGGRLVAAVAHGIVADGLVPFLHVAADNTGAARLYEALGMRTLRVVRFCVLQVQ